MMNTIGRLCLVGAVIAPLVAAGASFPSRTPLGGRRSRTAAGLGWLSATLAAISATIVGFVGPFSVSLGGAHATPMLGLWADQLTVTLLVLVCVVGAVVQSFSVRYLQADRSAGQFFGAANLTVAMMAIVCTSETLPLLVLAWVGAGLAFVAVLGTRPELPGVRMSSRRTLRMFLLGDLGLVVALAIIWLRAGNVDLVSAGALQTAVRQLGSLPVVVALLVLVAALTRSGQGPLGRWLPGTVSAPTPASALLHAGVVNGGGILLVRLGALSGDSALAMAAAFSVAGLTATLASRLVVHKADVKGSLAFSTMSQMGFMVAECAVGAYLAAVVHLIGHAMYKASLFFGSGSQVPRSGSSERSSTVHAARHDSTISMPARVAATLVATGATVAAMVLVPGTLAHRGGPVLLVFAAFTVAAAGWSWWGRCPASGRPSVLWTCITVSVGALYGLVLSGLGHWLAPALPFAGNRALSPWWLVAVLGAGIALAALERVPVVERWLLPNLCSIGGPPLDREPADSSPVRQSPLAGIATDGSQPMRTNVRSAA
ncbi:MAG: proton-conducting transporter transmembrane domain-containing protein [Acidimicrobiales bacterium]